MYGRRQGAPIYTQADWSGIGDKIAQALGFACAPPTVSTAVAIQAGASAPGAAVASLEARPHHPAGASARALAALKAVRRQSRPIADGRRASRAFAALKARPSDRRASAGRLQCDRLANGGVHSRSTPARGIFAARFQRRAPRRGGFDPGQLAPSGELGFERASDRR
jgi:hypothetical protein